MVKWFLVIDDKELLYGRKDYKMLSMARMNSQLTMGLKALEEVLTVAIDVPMSAEKAFRSRVAHLQRSGFPAAAKVGRKQRAVYGLDELLQLATVFSLVQAYVPPVIARRVVTDFWPEFARLLLAATRGRQLRADLAPGDAPVMVTIIPRALRDMGSADRVHGKGGVDQGGFDLRFHSGDFPDFDAGAHAERPVDELPQVATITLDFRVLAYRLSEGLGPARAAAFSASLEHLASRYGWTK